MVLSSADKRQKRQFKASIQFDLQDGRDEAFGWIRIKCVRGVVISPQRITLSDPKARLTGSLLHSDQPPQAPVEPPMDVAMSQEGRKGIRKGQDGCHCCSNAVICCCYSSDLLRGGRRFRRTCRIDTKSQGRSVLSSGLWELLRQAAFSDGGAWVEFDCVRLRTEQRRVRQTRQEGHSREAWRRGRSLGAANGLSFPLGPHPERGMLVTQ